MSIVVSAPAVRNDPPVVNDWGMVVRVLGGIIIGGVVDTDEVRHANATVTYVPAAAVTTTILAANPARRCGAFYSTASRAMYLKLGAGAALNSWTVRVLENEYFELIFPVYSGIVTAIWLAGSTGGVMVTEEIP